MQVFYISVLVGLVLGLCMLTAWNARLHELHNEQDQVLRTLQVCVSSPRYDTLEKVQDCLKQARKTQFDIDLKLKY